MKSLLALALTMGALACVAETNEVTQRLDSLAEGVGHTDAKLSRQINELLWFQRLSDVARVDKIRFAGPPSPDTNGFAPPPGEIYVGVESPKGELGCYLVSDGGPRPWRMRWRPPSLINIQLLSKLLPGHLIADAIAITASVDFVLGESDR